MKKSDRIMKPVAIVLAALCVMAFSVSAFAADPQTAPGNSADVPVTITAETANFSVTVPTSLPIAVAADGTVTCAQAGKAKITNNSSVAQVRVTGIAVSGANGWSTKAYSAFEPKKAFVGAKEFALTLQDESTTGANTISFSQAKWSDIESGKSMALMYSAKVAPQGVAISTAVTSANVVFTISYATQPAA